MPKIPNKKNQKKPMVIIPQSSLEVEFDVQIDFLKKSIRDFDNGDYSEFRRLSTTLRILLHRSRTSKPVIDHIGIDESAFISYAEPLNDRNMLSEFSLSMGVLTDSGAEFLPVLDRGPGIPRELSLEEWKDEPVLRDSYRETFTRWEIVLMIANKIGAHVDAEVEEKYYRLAQQNSIGFVYSGPDGEAPLLDIEKVYIRHIAWEALTSLEKKWDKIKGNRACLCGSGKKNRYCCAKSQKVRD